VTARVVKNRQERNGDAEDRDSNCDLSDNLSRT